MNGKARLLYIEDDPEIGGWLARDLRERGYEVEWRQSGEGAETLAEAADMAILDVMLPGLDGFTVGQKLKRSCPGLPILMLSARSAVEDKLQGLRFADDYMTKPFHPEELAARIEVLLRRFGKGEDQPVRLGHLLVRPRELTVTDGESGEEIALTPKQLQILLFLLRHPGRILTKEQIYESVWGEPYLEGDKTVMVHIRYLRERIEKDPANPTLVETVRGIGYRARPS
ncbi:response regulator transcription factor [Paenibacillus albicereus]|uniref:Response regulator transcription factor n=1 Tax=Paenibacillus albicereus TaxID=2726185 RepID=A0A6H2GSV7_9BACL|nr:response regulator transcription factor [Paenibacillus albicereus]QJC50490.1 response regulator transcription factor [Paenibacillus albicereus]